MTERNAEVELIVPSHIKIELVIAAQIYRMAETMVSRKISTLAEDA